MKPADKEDISTAVMLVMKAALTERDVTIATLKAQVAELQRRLERLERPHEVPRRVS